MSLLGNILWFVFGGFIACIGYILAGLSMCLTIIGIPFGLMFIRLGLATLAPFGKEVVARHNANGPLRVILNLIWIVCFGWGIAVSHLVWALVFAITIVGLPFAKQHVKMIPLALFPFGRDLV
jgi:uncharacterized membrane protein YccF (DUF307 family)